MLEAGVERQATPCPPVVSAQTPGRHAMPDRPSDAPTHGPVTQLIRRVQAGDGDAEEDLYRAVYDRLRGMAARHLRHEQNAATLSPTSLVHEAYLAMAGHEEGWADHAHLLAMASKAMRQILVDYARRRTAQKRGAGAAHVPLDEGMLSGAAVRLDEQAAGLLDLDQALTDLTARDARLGLVVECRVFGGLTTPETAAALSLSSSTVDRDWARARAYLRGVLG